MKDERLYKIETVLDAFVSMLNSYNLEKFANAFEDAGLDITGSNRKTVSLGTVRGSGEYIPISTREVELHDMGVHLFRKYMQHNDAGYFWSSLDKDNKIIVSRMVETYLATSKR